MAISPRRVFPGTSEKSKFELPKLSLIITAHNEEHRIRAKIENALQVEYPCDKLEIIVASDCSTDRTDDIVRSFAEKNVRLVRSNERKGKEYAQLCAIQKSSGDILVFSDVATQIPPSALHLLACEFENQNIGAVSSEDRFISLDGTVAGEGAYVRYEMWLRRLESQRAGLVGLSGSFFAARREVCDNWDIYSPSDFNTALNCAKVNLIAITAPNVVGTYSDVKDPKLEYQRKLRTIIRGMTAISRHPEVLNPFEMGWFAFEVWGHKILRWAVPWFMLSLFVTSLLLATDSWGYTFALLAQLIFYGIVTLGYFVDSLRTYTTFKIPYFFVQVNIAIAHASILFLSGKRMTTWNPSIR